MPEGASTLCVVHLEDLDVEVGIERLGAWRTRAARRLTPRLILPDLMMVAVATGRGDLCLVGRRSGKAGRADDVDDAGVGGAAGEIDRRRRR